MTMFASCTECNALLVSDEAYDPDYVDNSIVYHIAGHCPYCGKKFQWVRVYKFAGVENIEEVT